MKNSLILLCDYGLDDAAATAYLLQNAEKFEQIDILPIGGNMPLAASHRNAQRILHNFEGSTDKVRLVDTSSIPQNEEELFWIHGNDGMGDILSPEFEPFGNCIDFDAWLDRLPPNPVLVSLGPCTVTQVILEKAGAMPLLFMAGNIAEPPNYKGYEFNHGMDAAAFAACVKYPHRIATLDTCHHPNCNFYEIENNGSTLLHRFCQRSVELARSRKNAGSYVYDLITVTYLLQPGRFTTETLTDPFGNELTVLRYISDEKVISLSE